MENQFMFRDLQEQFQQRLNLSKIILDQKDLFKKQYLNQEKLFDKKKSILFL